MNNINIVYTSENLIHEFKNFNYITFLENPNTSQTNNFLNFIDNTSLNYLNISSIINNTYFDQSYIDFSKIKINSLQQYKMVLLLSASFYKNIIINENSFIKYKTEIIPFINDLYMYFNNTNLNIENLNIIYNLNDILIYKINSSYFLFNLSTNPKKINVPDCLKNKTFYSVFCNNDKYIKDSLILGKYGCFLFEEI